MAEAASKRTRRRASARARRATRRAEIQRSEAELAEQRSEAIAPAAQRHGVTAKADVRDAPIEEQIDVLVDGKGRPYARGKMVRPQATVVLRGPRIERDGITFKVSNPIAFLVARNSGTDRPMFTKRHADAAENLRHAWEEAAAGVSVGVAQYGGARGGNIPQTGYISPGTLLALDHQIAQREKIARAQQLLGPSLWRPIEMVVIRGIDVTAWAAQDKIDRKVATGYLAAALDRLAEFLIRQQKPRIRSAAVVPQGETRTAPARAAP